MKIRSKLLLTLLPLVLIPLIALGSIAYQYLRETSEKSLLGQAEVLLEQTVLQVEAEMNTAQANVSLFTESQLLQDYMLADENSRYELLQLPLLQLFANYQRAYPDYYEIRILLPDGYEDARYADSSQANLTDLETNTPYFQNIASSNEDIVSQFIISPDNQQPILLISKKLVFTDPRVLGVDSMVPVLRGYFLLNVHLDFIARQVKSAHIGQQGLLFFTDASGRILFHPDATQIGQTLSKNYLQASTAAATPIWEQDTAYQILKRRLHNNLYIFAQLPEQEIAAAGRELGLFAFAILALALGASLLLLFLMLRHVLVHPLESLGAAVACLGQGKMDIQLALERQDEIGDLARRFNQMVRDLNESQAQKDAAQQEALHQREQAIENLTQADRLKDEFLANTSHELRTPLNGIIGLSESLLDGIAGELPPKARQDLSMMAASGRRLAALVNDILDYSKLQHKNILLKQRPISLRELVAVVLTLSRLSAAQKGLSLYNEIDEELPQAWADENRLQQVLFNLIGNAIKFTPQGYVKVFAKLTHEHSDTMLQISVQDTGIGINAEQQQRIFSSFEQGDGSISREFGGTGLGLAISKSLVELHGGKLSVSSAPGQGACFSFTLPVAKADSSPEHTEIIDDYTKHNFSNNKHLTHAPVPTESTTAAITEVDPNAFKILIVDDEPVNLQVLSNYLILGGYQVTCDNSGMAAIQRVEQGFRPDLVILDIMMPKMTGYEVCERLRSCMAPTELPILMLSAKDQVHDLVAGFDMGANDYLTKPIAKGELLARVKTHIHLHHLNNAYRRFVPHEFLRFLEKDSIIDIQLGDQVEREMTVMFSDIRNFTALSEKLSPQENFNFLNSYLSCMEPMISKHHGFIDKYIGDAIMALFPTNPDDAVQSAIAMMQNLVEYNYQRWKQNQAPINIGIALNTGNLMLGTVGGRNRMDSTVISDSVNLAARLESMTKVYGVSVLISEHTRDQLKDPRRYAMRMLDRIQVRGKSEPITLYEVFNGDPEALQELKLQTLELFEQGVAYYREKKFSTALLLFEKILHIYPDDKAAQIYAQRCAHLKQHGVARDWQGVEVY